MSIFNTYESLTHRVVNVYLTTCLVAEVPACVSEAARKDYFAGKMVMLLTNSQQIDFSQAKIKEARKESLLNWYSINLVNPHTNRISFQRTRY